MNFNNGTLVYGTTERTTTAWSDSYTLLDNGKYYYALYVVADSMQHGCPSDEVVTNYSIPVVTYPFCDDLESGTANWGWGSPWGPTSAAAHGGSQSWPDSPGGLYENDVNSALETQVNLTGGGVLRPVLKFWERYELEANGDSQVTWTYRSDAGAGGRRCTS